MKKVFFLVLSIGLGMSLAFAQAPFVSYTTLTPGANYGNAGVLGGTTGDVNGDGYKDIISTVYVATGDSVRIAIWLNSEFGLEETPSIILTPLHSKVAFAAISLAVGDLNADGYDDVVVGTQFYKVDANPNAGKAVAFLGKADMTSTDVPDFEFQNTNIANSYYFGCSVTTGDFNADGVVDLAIGDYYATLSYDENIAYAGNIHVYYGGTGFDNVEDLLIEGRQGKIGGDGYALSELWMVGVSLASGDFNGDGITDLFGSSYAGGGYGFGSGDNFFTKYNQGVGLIWLGGTGFDGIPDVAMRAPMKVWALDNYIYLGYGIANAGDYDGDGTDDLYMGSHSWGVGCLFLGSKDLYNDPAVAILNTAGRDSLYTTKVDDDPIVIWAAAGDHVGYNMNYMGQVGLPLGDINGDGKSDLAVADTWNDTQKLYVYLGTDIPFNTPMPDLELTDEAGGAYNNARGAFPVGDMDGDGIDDFALSNGSSLYILSGTSAVEAPKPEGKGIVTEELVALTGGPNHGNPGILGGMLADVNGDGYKDIVASLYVATNDSVRIGIWLNSEFGLEETPSVILTPLHSKVAFAAISLAVGDLNADGYDDIVVGTPFYKVDTNPNAGKAVAFLGKPDIASTDVPDFEFQNANIANSYYFGCSATIGDFNADGSNDLAIGDYYATRSDNENYTFAGNIHIYYGGTNFDTVEDLLIEGRKGTITGMTLWIIGVSLASGDFNGDGITDLFGSSYGASGYGFGSGDNFFTKSNQGLGLVWLGGAGFDGIPDVALRAPMKVWAQDDYIYLGYGIANAGDYDGDGTDDLYMGSHSWGVGCLFLGDKDLYNDPAVATLDMAGMDSLYNTKVDDDPIVIWAAAGDHVGYNMNYMGQVGLPLGDLNGDGFHELGVIDWWNDTQSLYMYLGTDKSYMEPLADVVLTDETGGAYSNPRSAFPVGDWDGDGMDDFAIANGVNLKILKATITTGVSGHMVNVVRNFTLYQNYPNPFNPSTTIRFELATPERVSVKVYNVFGQLVRTLVDQPMSAGLHEITWDGRNNTNLKVASGIYFYRIRTQNYIQTKKMILVR